RFSWWNPWSPTDRLVIGYLFFLTAWTLLGWHRITHPALHLTLNLILMLTFAGRSRLLQSSSSGWSSVWLLVPIPLLVWWYPQATLLRHVLFPTDLDAWILPVERFLFRTELYRLLPRLLPRWTSELLHGIYFLYYLLLFFIPYLGYARDPRLARETVFSILGTMLSLQIVIMIFPTSGPVYLHDQSFPDPGWFTRLMNWVYRTFDQGGGAFPSIHSAAAVVLVAYGSRLFPAWRAGLLTFLILLLLATVACSYHYTLDMVSGAVIGRLSLPLWTRLYTVWNRT
ncbi:MAG: phosphatase PAP2 family protein, partial [Candidatus Neomarinimicrobiota bacterium]